MSYIEGSYDVAVIGAGHAGCEAALAAARLGLETVIFSVSLDSIAMMPCNPSIGGTSKGHLVREIDALGGEMGKNIDKTYLQSRMLNTGKGPAVHSLRAQADKFTYSKEMKRVLENTPKLTIKQSEVTDIIVEDKKIVGVKTISGAIYNSKAIIIASGTYLKARCIYGEVSINSGPNGLLAANNLSQSLKEHNIELYRFKTGTPARIDKSTIDFAKMDEQKGDEKIVPFSFLNNEEDIKRDQIPCWLTYTNINTHDIIRNNLDRSPLYSGVIEGTGPRYCPSIEDKVVRFQDKERHQVFLEPEGEYTNEMYVQGMSSSLPEDVQRDMLRTLPGLEECVIMRPGYAIEYDCINPLQLNPTLEFKSIEGLYSAGQFNGSSGYEEAAAQGLIAGINASMKILGNEQIVLHRSDAYIGVLIDDLVTKGTNEPYRMMTSRAEYRLILRQDNADLRLSSIGHKVGLIDDDRYSRLKDKEIKIEKEIYRLRNTRVGATKEIEGFLDKHNSSLIKSGITLAELLRRPELNYDILKEIDVNREELDDDVIEQVNISLKYEGYISRQQKQVAQFKKLEKKYLPNDLNYSDIKGLRIEAMQKLNNVKPRSIGQASRISGVSPADISVLLVYLEQLRRSK
ncbi:MAG: tRNA uridine-5-carboxymethylaminomethyl(34) synthesis enzyme MnmG [Vallitalea sp.]|jgi:tRNA uridine 5-carboxymethylaminomethyl modification enzyme|nr:tRNA uridine-5-carboxymethylaminomethyl(34) synthesis enzyme MnmG [Vallitalea sp.]